MADVVLDNLAKVYPNGFQAVHDVSLTFGAPVTRPLSRAARLVPRWGPLLGTMALELVAHRRPDTEILLAGQHLGATALPFRFTSLGALQVDALNDYYARYRPQTLLAALIPLMIANAQADKPLPVYGEGLNVRDWLYVEDHCRAIDLILENGRVGEVYNIGGIEQYQGQLQRGKR